MTLITVATCNLNQWAMDFDGNMERIWESCVRAKQAGACYRLGPELEVCGYGCEDHFYEMDTIQHSWESLVTLIERGATDDMLCDFGLPVLHHGVRYNARVLALNRTILLVRPKLALADNGNYRESRWFTAYQPPISPNAAVAVDTMVLPPVVQQALGQCTTPFGIQSLSFLQNFGLTIGCESCEELWTPAATHIALALQGVDLIGNGSGSHHELRKLDIRLDLAVSQATRKNGGIYCYANQRGCDGGRLYYDGGAFIAVNGVLLVQGPQFAVDDDVHVITATVDLDEVRSYRACIPSTGVQSAALHSRCGGGRAFYIDCAEQLLKNQPTQLIPTAGVAALKHCPEEECCLGPACWLWDYLRRSGASGFFLPLSGGADSSSVAAIVAAMCTMVTEAARSNPAGPTARDCRRICQQQSNVWVPTSPQDLANHVLHTAFMGTENSSNITQSRARRLAEALGSYHLSIAIDAMVQAVISVFAKTTTKTPRFVVQGGTKGEDLALQNIQARLRMVTAYLYAQLLPWVRHGKSGFLLVLGSANVDEGLRGYMTKYDCSSADLNPIGGISKGDLKKMLLWAAETYNTPVLAEIAAAPPTAELRPQSAAHTDSSDSPITREHSQLDEDEMGMSYEELGYFGKLRKLSRCGPVSM
jgi:NAD+ synthase (glutamine-hydrolysing)